jgi:hypothetical protein
MVVRKSFEPVIVDQWFAGLLHDGSYAPIDSTSRHIIGYGVGFEAYLFTGPLILVESEAQAVAAAKILLACPPIFEIGCGLCQANPGLGWLRFDHLVRGAHSFLSPWDPWPWEKWPPVEWGGRIAQP